MTGSQPDISDFTVPTAEELISVENINDINARWIENELSHLTKLSEENFSNLNKPQLLQKLSEEGKRAIQVKNLIRVLYRLAKANATSEKICDDIIKAVSTRINVPQQENSYAQALKMPGQKMPISTPVNTATSHSKPAQVLSPSAPIFTPSPKHEITIVPKNYGNDVKSIQKTLERSQVSGVRKSRSGNIVLSFPSGDSMQSAQTVLAAKPEIKLHTQEKTLPKLTIRNVDLADDEIRNSIL